MARIKDLTGLTFGNLTAIQATQTNSAGCMVWQWQCVCGNIHYAAGNQIKAVAKLATNPKVPSCGCVSSAVKSARSTTHGLSGHPLIAIWQAMKQRCYNPKHREYARYGLKGVTVVPEWRDRPDEFLEWALTNGWAPGKHLDKDIKSDALGTARAYGPDTCQFVEAKKNVGYSASRQNYKQNTNIRVLPTDVAQIKAQYQSGEYDQRDLAAIYGVSQTTIWRILHS